MVQRWSERLLDKLYQIPCNLSRKQCQLQQKLSVPHWGSPNAKAMQAMQKTFRSRTRGASFLPTRRLLGDSSRFWSVMIQVGAVIQLPCFILFHPISVQPSWRMPFSLFQTPLIWMLYDKLFTTNFRTISWLSQLPVLGALTLEERIAEP